jgi:glutamine synthetase
MGEYINVVETFGCDVFNDSVMQARLPKKIYNEKNHRRRQGAVYGDRRCSST